MSLAPAAASVTGPLFAHGFSLRKRSLLRAFTGRPDITFVSRGDAVAQGSTLLLWGRAPVPGGVPADVQVIRVEDGFIRSVGLGADFIRPLSWVFDAAGIHYDATRPSTLENILQKQAFSPHQLERAAVLRKRVVEAGITKYNVRAAAWRRPAGDRKVLLVVGQVETDASITLGTVDVRTNIRLLETVREAQPHAWIVYKPHPDVVARLRRRGKGEEDALLCCDEVVRHGDINQMFQQVDEVHVMTSLAGFEALLRGKKVFCHGQPFYAGYGLTQDRHPVDRRTRLLSVEELVAGALIEYPVYASRQSGRLCTAERVVQELLEWRAAAPATPAWRKMLRPLIARP